MKLKNILIVVKDIEKSKQFYNDLFGLDLVLDNDGNMILTEGLVLQDEKIWKKFLGKDIIPKSNSCELYFEEQDIEAFVEKLERSYPCLLYTSAAASCTSRGIRRTNGGRTATYAAATRSARQTVRRTLSAPTC